MSAVPTQPNPEQVLDLLRKIVDRAGRATLTDSCGASSAPVRAALLNQAAELIGSDRRF